MSSASSEPPLLDFLLAWYTYTSQQRKVRLEHEAKLRAQFRERRKQEGLESAKMSVKVCFRKWRSYLALRKEERRKEAKERMANLERMAKAKHMATKAVLNRRRSTVGSFRRSSCRGSGRRESPELDERFAELDKERAAWMEERGGREEAYRRAELRQMKALHVIAEERRRLFRNSGNRAGWEPSGTVGAGGTRGRSWTAPDELNLGEGVDARQKEVMSAEALRLGQRAFLRSLNRSREEVNPISGEPFRSAPTPAPVGSAVIREEEPDGNNWGSGRNSPFLGL